MEKHPGGLSLTRRLLALAGLPGRAEISTGLPRYAEASTGLPRCAEASTGLPRRAEIAAARPLRILDMGAGDGQTVDLLCSMGLAAQGIDLALPAVEADRALKNVPPPKETAPGQRLLEGDFLHCPFPDESFDAVISECAFYLSGDAPSAVKEAARILKSEGLLLLSDVSFADTKTHRRQLEEAGFAILQLEDCTPAWQEYYIACIWDGTERLLCPGTPRGKCRYYLTVAQKLPRANEQPAADLTQERK